MQFHIAESFSDAVARLPAQKQKAAKDKRARDRLFVSGVAPASEYLNDMDGVLADLSRTVAS